MAAATSTSELSAAMVWRFVVFIEVVEAFLDLMPSLGKMVADLEGDSEMRKDVDPVKLRGESLENDTRASSALSFGALIGVVLVELVSALPRPVELCFVRGFVRR
jgi:hypothetical protein